MSNGDRIFKISVKTDVTLKDAIKKMDENRQGVICVVDNDQNLKGILTDGDFRRLVLNGISLETPIEQVMNPNPLTFQQSEYNEQEAREIFRRRGIIYLPIVDGSRLVDMIFESSILRMTADEDKFHGLNGLNLSAIIMAGGFGNRLQPFTNVLPKPLIPINDSSVAELIMESFMKNGVKQFIFSINYKGKMIRAYFDDYPGDCAISFIEETKPLGTAGALKLLGGRLNSTFFVSNCDILLSHDYRKIYDFHKERSFAMTLVSSLQHYQIPYGVCEIKNGGELTGVREKPEYDMLINIGFYLLEPDVIEYIPDDTFFHMTDLIKKLRDMGHKIGVYPVSHSSWTDVGQWEDYKKVVRRLRV